MSQAQASKIFKTRDSCTSLLRKLGVKPLDYGMFIEKMADGRFACQVVKAEMHLRRLQAPELQAAASKRKGLAAEFRQLISEGLTNAEVWATMSAKHGLDDSKKHYAAWYRAEMARKGRA